MTNVAFEQCVAMTVTEVAKGRRMAQVWLSATWSSQINTYVARQYSEYRITGCQCLCLYTIFITFGMVPICLVGAKTYRNVIRKVFAIELFTLFFCLLYLLSFFHSSSFSSCLFSIPSNWERVFSSMDRCMYKKTWLRSTYTVNHTFFHSEEFILNRSYSNTNTSGKHKINSFWG